MPIQGSFIHLRNKSYLTITKLFEILDDYVNKNQIVTISGPHGIGKTALAAEYAHDLAAKHQVFWFTFFPLHYFYDDIAGDITKGEANAALSKLRLTTEVAFVILDNVDDFERIQSLITGLPPNIRVIITTTAGIISDKVANFELRHPNRQTRDYLFNKLLKVPHNEYSRRLVNALIDRQTPVLPIEICCMAGVMNNYESVIDETTLFYLKDYCSYDTEKSFIVTMLHMLTDLGDKYAQCLNASEEANRSRNFLNGMRKQVSGNSDAVFSLMRELNLMTLVSANGNEFTYVVPRVVFGYFCDFERCMDPMIRLPVYKERAGAAYRLGDLEDSFNYYAMCAVILAKNKLNASSSNVSNELELAQVTQVAAEIADRMGRTDKAVQFLKISMFSIMPSYNTLFRRYNELTQGRADEKNSNIDLNKKIDNEK